MKDEQEINSDYGKETETIDLSTLITEPLTFPEEGPSTAIQSSQFGKLFEALPLPALLIEPSGVITFANKACERIHKDFQLILGRPFSDLFPNRKLQSKALYLFEEIFNVRQPRTEEAEMRIHDRSIWARMNFRSVRIKGDRAALVLIEDLTHEKTQINKERQYSEKLRQEISVRETIEKALRENREKLTLALNGADITLWDWDIATDSLASDDRFSELLGYRPDEIGGRRGSWGELMPREDYGSFEQAIRDLLKGRSKFLDIEHCIRTKSGDWKWVLTRGKVVTRDGHGRALRALGTILDITEHKKNQERIRALTGDLIKAQEDERRKIALDLHDDIAQRVASLNFFLQPLTSDLARHQPDTGSEIARVYKIIEQLVESVRSMSYELRPYSLDREGLVSAIRTHCAEFTTRNKIRVEFFPLDIEEARLDRDTKINLFRLVQEALNNVRKHARASAVRIRLQGSLYNLVLTIQDNGEGFPVEKVLASAVARKKMGLLGMEQRASLMGGSLSIKSVLGRGSRISIEVPWKRNTHEGKEEDPHR